MQIIVLWRLCLFSLLVSVSLTANFCNLSESYGNFERSSDLTYAIALTSIPPRFKFLTIPISSWINQVLPPDRICLFIPKFYKRFKRKDNQIPYNNLEDIRKQLSANPQLERSLVDQMIRIVPMDKDWGPITRFVGVLMEPSDLRSESSCYGTREKLPDYWIIGDDDVRYSPHTILKYNYYLQNFESLWNGQKSVKVDSSVLTQFVETYRIFYHLHQSREDTPITPRHLQGVDTYLFSTELLREHRKAFSVLHYQIASKIILQFHKDFCPESFYQDDYLVSFLFSLANVSIYSIWNNDKLTEHIDNVSLSNFQMHRDGHVFRREERTKSCIYSNAPSIYLNFISSHVFLDL